MKTSVRFGFLLEDLDLTFSHGKITSIPEFARNLEALSKITHSDGYLYPPADSSEMLTQPGDASISTRPSFLFLLPASHQLDINPAIQEIDIRKGSAAFLVHLLAFLFGTRLQFSDWFFDGRIPIRTRHGLRLPNLSALAGEYLSSGYKVWTGWSRQDQGRFINILYLHSRGYLSQWTWEGFILQYMIADACWKMGKSVLGFKAKHHADRLHEIYSHFHVYLPPMLDLKQIVELRNDLFHEATWLGGRPGEASLFRLGYDPTTVLDHLNATLIASFLGIIR